MQVHLFVALPASVMLHKAAAATFDLHLSSRLILDILDVAATMTDDLCTQVEAGDRLKVDRNALFRPLATTELVTLEGWVLLLRLLLLALVTSTEASLVDQVRQLLLHELVDFDDGFLEAVLGLTRDVEVKRGVLFPILAHQYSFPLTGSITYGGGGQTLIRVVISAGGDIFTLVSVET